MREVRCGKMRRQLSDLSRKEERRENMLDTNQQAECIARRVADKLIKSGLTRPGIGKAEIQLPIEPLIKEELEAIEKNKGLQAHPLPQVEGL